MGQECERAKGAGAERAPLSRRAQQRRHGQKAEGHCRAVHIATRDRRDPDRVECDAGGQQRPQGEAAHQPPDQEMDSDNGAELEEQHQRDLSPVDAEHPVEKGARNDEGAARGVVVAPAGHHRSGGIQEPADIEPRIHPSDGRVELEGAKQENKRQAQDEHGTAEHAPRVDGGRPAVGHHAQSSTAAGEASPASSRIARWTRRVKTSSRSIRGLSPDA